MNNFSLRLLVSFLIILFFPNISFSEDTTSKDDSELYNPVPAIMHHISDSHEWHLLGEGDASVTIPLPVILITEGNLDIFMSSAFNHGRTDVVKGDRVYSMDSHGHIHEKNHLSI